MAIEHHGGAARFVQRAEAGRHGQSERADILSLDGDGSRIADLGVHAGALPVLLEAVQLQPEPVVTVTEPLLAVAMGVALVEEIEYVQPPVE